MTDTGAQWPAQRSAPSNGNFFEIVLVVAFALFIGVGSAQLAVETTSGFGGVAIGPWQTHPRIGTFTIDPYARAAIIRRKELPLGVGEGLSFTAYSDSSGLPLNSQCSYRIAGEIPVARAWTLAAHRPDGARFSPSNLPHYLTSAMIVFEPDKGIVINASPTVQPGNWLPLPKDAPMVLVLRFYDLSASLASSAIERTQLPQIERVSCQ